MRDVVSVRTRSQAFVWNNDVFSARDPRWNWSGVLLAGFAWFSGDVAVTKDLYYLTFSGKAVRGLETSSKPDLVCSISDGNASQKLDSFKCWQPS